MLVRASLSAPNLGVALVRWCRHHGLLTDHIGLRLQRDGAQAHLTLTEHRPLHNAQHHWQEFCVVSVLRNAMGVAQWLIDSQLRLHQVQLAFAPPTHASAYAVLFDGPVRFDAPEHRLSFDAGYLGLPIKRDEAALQRMLQRALLLTVRPYRRDRLLRERVRALLLGGQGGPGPAATAADLAEALHVSERTLHRQLKDEGASLQAIKDDVRRQRAQDLLQRSRKPIKHLAAEVGFGSEKSFIRAFRGWTGQTPDGYRQGQLSND
jgi:AraC-like DNA-binding protein